MGIANLSVLLIVALAAFDVLGQFCFKKSHNSGEDIGSGSMFFVLGFVAYLFYACSIYALLKSKKMATTGVLHTLSHFIVLGTVFLIGKFYFGEKYSYTEIVGLSLGLVSVFILLGGVDWLRGRGFSSFAHGSGLGHSHGSGLGHSH